MIATNDKLASCVADGLSFLNALAPLATSASFYTVGNHIPSMRENAVMRSMIIS